MTGRTLFFKDMVPDVIDVGDHFIEPRHLDFGFLDNLQDIIYGFLILSLLGVRFLYRLLFEFLVDVLSTSRAVIVFFIELAVLLDLSNLPL